MLSESIIRIGRAVKQGETSFRKKIRLLTDVGSENCKNYFRNAFIVEVSESEADVQFLQLGDVVTEDKKENFKVDTDRSTAFPIFYPNGGNPLHAQGVYALPCYLMYDPHMKALGDPDQFKKEFLLPRLHSTLQYKDMPEEKKEALADRIAALLKEKAVQWVKEEKQLGILMIYDASLSIFQRDQERKIEDTRLWISASPLQPGSHLYLDGAAVLECIYEAKFEEAAELGKERQAVSTFTNEIADEVVSIYNKSWLWLSPTWEMPRSISWKDDEWIKGIKVDKESYSAYLHGVQTLKGIQKSVSNAILKELFAPITSAEAKKNMKGSSFEPIYGIPIVLPLLDGNAQSLFEKYRKMLNNVDEKQNTGDLQMGILAGIDRMVPAGEDDHRLTILYYSGDLSRGNMHIRAVIEDVIPSVAGAVEWIFHQLKVSKAVIQAAFEMDSYPDRRIESLPALLANAFGPGYVWETLQAVLHKEPLRVERLYLTTSRKLNELANKEEYWQMKQELVFYYAFLFFIHQYENDVLQIEGSVKTLADWDAFIESYKQGTLELNQLETVEQLGFAAGLLLKQFSNSYYQKKRKENPKADFIKERVMIFGSKLTPELVWKNGLLRCETMSKQLEMRVGANFHPVLGQTLLGFLEFQQQLVPEKEMFMTAFWSGYLLYKSDKKNEMVEENGGNEDE